MKTTLNIPDELYRQGKVKAANESRKVKDLVSEGLRLVLGLAPRIPLPPVAAHGQCDPCLEQRPDGVMA